MIQITKQKQNNGQQCTLFPYSPCLRSVKDQRSTCFVVARERFSLSERYCVTVFLIVINNNIII